MKTLITLFLLCFSVTSSALTLRIGHNASIDDPRTWAAETFSEKVGELSEGNIKVRVFPAGQLGDTRQMLEGLKIGTLDIHLDDPGVLAVYGNSALIPWIPFLYRSEEHFFNVWNSELGEKILSDIEKETGYKQFGMLYRGSRNISSTKPLQNASDFSGLKIRVPNSPMMISGFRSVGASPTPMSFTEVFGALQRNVIDAQENPVDLIVSSSLYQVSPNIVLTNHIYGSFYFQMWGQRFERLKDSEKEAILEAARYTSIKYNERVQSVLEEALTKLKSTPNVVVLDPSAEEISELEKAVMEMVKGQYANLMPVVEEIRRN